LNAPFELQIKFTTSRKKKSHTHRARCDAIIKNSNVGTQTNSNVLLSGSIKINYH